MAKLTAKARKDLKPSKFALKGKDGKPGKYPVNDKSHAANAKARAAGQLAKGKLSPEQAAKIRHKADQVLGKTDSTYHCTGC